MPEGLCRFCQKNIVMTGGKCPRCGELVLSTKAKIKHGSRQEQLTDIYFTTTNIFVRNPVISENERRRRVISDSVGMASGILVGELLYKCMEHHSSGKEQKLPEYSYFRLCDIYEVTWDGGNQIVMLMAGFGTISIIFENINNQKDVFALLQEQVMKNQQCRAKEAERRGVKWNCCRNCGAEVAEVNSICTNCGTPMYHYETLPQPIRKKKGSVTWAVVTLVIILAFALFAVVYAIMSEPPRRNHNVKTTKKITEKTVAYHKGICTETTYESEFIGIRYTLPKGWTMAREKMEGKDITYEMWSESEDTDLVITVTHSPGKSIEQMVSVLRDSVQESGWEIKEMKESEQIIAGETYHQLSATTDLKSAIIVTDMFIREIDGYYVVIQVSNIGESASAQVLESITVY